MWNSEEIEFILWTAAGITVGLGCVMGAWESGREYGRREQHKTMLDKLNQKEMTDDRQKETPAR